MRWSPQWLRLGAAGLGLVAGAWWATGWPVATVIVTTATLGLQRVLGTGAIAWMHRIPTPPTAQRYLITGERGTA